MRDVARDSLSGFVEDEGLRLAASLAYYSIFSLAPLLVIVVAIAGAVFGAEAVSGRLEADLRGFFGADSAKTIQSMVESAGFHKGAGIVASIAGIATLLFGASGVFGQLRSALNDIWDVPVDPERQRWRSGWRGLLFDRLLSFAMVLSIGFLLLISLVITTALEALNQGLSARMPLLPVLWQALDLVVSLGVITLLFALIYRVLPDTRIRFKDALRGGFVAALLFSGGRHLLGLYLARESTMSAYGAAGSVVVILMWIYFSAITILLGAELIWAWAPTAKRTAASAATPALPSAA